MPLLKQWNSMQRFMCKGHLIGSCASPNLGMTEKKSPKASSESCTTLKKTYQKTEYVKKRQTSNAASSVEPTLLKEDIKRSEVG